MLAVAFGASVAMGHDHRPPRAELRAGGDAHRLGYWSYGWTHPDGKFCVTEQADGFPNYRPRLVVEHLHSRPRVLFRKDQRPRAVSLHQYRRLRNGVPVGEGRRLDVSLMPRRRGGEIVGWAARFRATVPDRRFYDLSASWRDEEGCDGPESVATSFSLAPKHS